MAKEKKLSKKELKNFIKHLTNLNSYVIISYGKEREKELKRVKKLYKTLDNLEFLCYNKV